MNWIECAQLKSVLMQGAVCNQGGGYISQWGFSDLAVGCSKVKKDATYS